MSNITVRFPDFPDVPELSTEKTGEGHWLVDVDNWWDGVGSRVADDPRPDADGDFEQDPVYADARYPIVIGRLRFSDEAMNFAARKPFSRLMASRGPIVLEVSSLDGVQRASVVRNGPLGWDLSQAPYLIEFKLPFKAADPRKYGPLKTASTGLPVAGGGVQSPVVSPFSQIGGGNPGRITLANYGTTDTIPSLRVAGGGMSGGVELLRIDTQQRLRLEWPISDTDQILFSPGDGQVWLNNQSPISGYLTVADWWTVEPGGTALVQFISIGAVTGTPILTAEWRDADL